MKKIFILAVAALAMGFSACSDNYADEQMQERALIVNKGNKAEKTNAKQDKNAKRGIMLLKGKKTEKVKLTKDEKEGVMPLSTRSVAMYVEDDIVRHPTAGDGSATSDKPASGGGSASGKKSDSHGMVTKPLR